MLLKIFSNISQPQHEAMHLVRHKAAREKPIAINTIATPSDFSLNLAGYVVTMKEHHQRAEKVLAM